MPRNGPRTRIFCTWDDLVKMEEKQWFGRFGLLLAMLAVAGCASKPLNQIMLMPAPDVYEEGRIDPFVDNEAISSAVQPPIL